MEHRELKQCGCFCWNENKLIIATQVGYRGNFWTVDYDVERRLQSIGHTNYRNDFVGINRKWHQDLLMFIDIQPLIKCIY